MKNTTTDQWINPIIEQRADPWIYKHLDGFYYFTASVPQFDCIELRKSEAIGKLGNCESKIVWKEHKFGEMSKHIWAPEIHFIQGKWYIYFAAAHSQDQWRIRMYVLENENSDPLNGTWIEKGQIKTLWESFSLDATTFEIDNNRYLVWAQHDPEIGGNSNIYIDEMINPWTLSGKQVMISEPAYTWEKKGYRVNEGPAILLTEEKIFITYSASATDANYCLGLLSADVKAPLLNAESWIKCEQPLFVSNEKNSQFGPGHNSFTRSKDDKEIIMVYHARNYKEIVGDPLNDHNRHTRAQVVKVLDGDKLSLGEPIKDGLVTVS